jgi:hypothetical protein
MRRYYQRLTQHPVRHCQFHTDGIYSFSEHRMTQAFLIEKKKKSLLLYYYLLPGVLPTTTVVYPFIRFPILLYPNRYH